MKVVLWIGAQEYPRAITFGSPTRVVHSTFIPPRPQPALPRESQPNRLNPCQVRLVQKKSATDITFYWQQHFKSIKEFSKRVNYLYPPFRATRLWMESTVTWQIKSEGENRIFVIWNRGFYFTKFTHQYTILRPWSVYPVCPVSFSAEELRTTDKASIFLRRRNLRGYKYVYFRYNLQNLPDSLNGIFA